MEDIKVLVGAQLRQIRKSQGLTQSSVAERAEMADTYLAGVERGERNISLESLNKIVQALDVAPIDAFRFGDLHSVIEVQNKRNRLMGLVSLLEERSEDEINLIFSITENILNTFDKRK